MVIEIKRKEEEKIIFFSFLIHDSIYSQHLLGKIVERLRMLQRRELLPTLETIHTEMGIEKSWVKITEKILNFLMNQLLQTRPFLTGKIWKNAKKWGMSLFENDSKRFWEIMNRRIGSKWEIQRDKNSIKNRHWLPIRSLLFHPFEAILTFWCIVFLP